jgi:hypothetical protein
MTERERGERKDDESAEAGFGEETKKDTKPAPEEGLNTYWTRKQRGVQSRLATDGDVYLWDGDQDKDCEADNYSYGQKGNPRPRSRVRHGEGYDQGGSGSGLDALHRGASAKHSREE